MRLGALLTKGFDKALLALDADSFVGWRDTGEYGMAMPHLPQIRTDHAPRSPIIDLMLGTASFHWPV